MFNDNFFHLAPTGIAVHQPLYAFHHRHGHQHNESAWAQIICKYILSAPLTGATALYGLISGLKITKQKAKSVSLLDYTAGLHF